MTTQVIFLGNSSRFELLQTALEKNKVRLFIYDLFPSEQQLIGVKAIIIDCLQKADISVITENLRILRFTYNFKGSVVLIAYSPIEKLLKDHEVSIFSNYGFLIAQAPLLIRELTDQILNASSLTDEEIIQMQKKEEAWKMSNYLDKLSHDYTNNFMWALASLLKLERYIGYEDKTLRSELDKIIMHFQLAKLHLPIQTIIEFRSELVKLQKQLPSWLPEITINSIPAESLLDDVVNYVSLDDSLDKLKAFEIRPFLYKSRDTRMTIIGFINYIESLKKVFDEVKK